MNLQQIGLIFKNYMEKVAKYPFLCRSLFCKILFSGVHFCISIMWNTVILYYLVFLEIYLLLNGTRYGYCMFTCASFRSINTWHSFSFDENHKLKNLFAKVEKVFILCLPYALSPVCAFWKKWFFKKCTLQIKQWAWQTLIKVLNNGGFTFEKPNWVHHESFKNH